MTDYAAVFDKEGVVQSAVFSGSNVTSVQVLIINLAESDFGDDNCAIMGNRITRVAGDRIPSGSNRHDNRMPPPDDERERGGGEGG